jgi:hypothetical protein
VDLAERRAEHAWDRWLSLRDALNAAPDEEASAALTEMRVAEAGLCAWLDSQKVDVAWDPRKPQVYEVNDQYTHRANNGHRMTGRVTGMRDGEPTYNSTEAWHATDCYGEDGGQCSGLDSAPGAPWPPDSPVGLPRSSHSPRPTRGCNSDARQRGTISRDRASGEIRRSRRVQGRSKG